MPDRLYTPVKKKKGQELIDAADQLFSTTVSRIRQPIEFLFNWLEEKTKIQIASKVRSYNGLMVHVFGKLSSAFFLLSQNLALNWHFTPLLSSILANLFAIIPLIELKLKCSFECIT